MSTETPKTPTRTSRSKNLERVEMNIDQASAAFQIERKTLERRLSGVGIAIRPGKRYRLADLCRAVVSDYVQARTTVAEESAKRMARERLKDDRELIPVREAADVVQTVMDTLLMESERIFVHEIPPDLAEKTTAEVQKRCKHAHAQVVAAVRKHWQQWTQKSQRS